MSVGERVQAGFWGVVNGVGLFFRTLIDPDAVPTSGPAPSTPAGGHAGASAAYGGGSGLGRPIGRIVNQGGSCSSCG